MSRPSISRVPLARLIAAILATQLLGATATLAETPAQRAAAALAAAPVWDGHNDIPEQLRDRRKDVLGNFDFTDTRGTGDPQHDFAPMMTDLTRARAGHLGAQFWSVYVSAKLSEPQAVLNHAVHERVTDVTP